MACRLPPAITADNMNSVVTQMENVKNVRRGLLGGRSFAVTVQDTPLRVSLNAVIREAKALNILDDTLKSRFTKIDADSCQASGFLEQIWKWMHTIRSLFLLAGKNERARLLATQPTQATSISTENIVEPSKPLVLHTNHADYQLIDPFVEAFLANNPGSASVLQFTVVESNKQYNKFFDCALPSRWLSIKSQLEECKNRLRVVTEKEFNDFKVAYTREQTQALIKKLESYCISHDLRGRLARAQNLYREMEKSDARYGKTQQRIYVCFDKLSMYVVGPTDATINQRLLPRSEKSLGERVKELLDAIKREHAFEGRIVIIGNPGFYDASQNYVYEQMNIDY